MTSIIPRLSRPIQRSFTALLLLGLTWFAQTVRLASGEVSPLSCSSLHAVVSTDKQNFTFTATASGGDSGAITGYTFNFGDRQSYAYGFSRASTDNYYRATVSHSYQNLGAFTATVHVDYMAKGKPKDVTSPGCKVAINTGPTTLVNTGAGNPFALFLILFLVGMAAYEAWLRIRPARAKA